MQVYDHIVLLFSKE